MYISDWDLYLTVTKCSNFKTNFAESISLITTRYKSGKILFWWRCQLILEKLFLKKCHIEIISKKNSTDQEYMLLARVGTKPLLRLSKQNLGWCILLPTCKVMTYHKFQINVKIYLGAIYRILLDKIIFMIAIWYRYRQAIIWIFKIFNPWLIFNNLLMSIILCDCTGRQAI